jgi:nitrite reductase (NADH) small subunit/3-phenylpropionate/trans-cinnamate dioxygenase ferredoxin subunit
MADFVRVASKNELAPGSCTTVKAGETEVALFNVDGNFYAVHNTCKHRGGPLGEGDLEGTTVTCPWHGWTYDVTNGKCTFNEEVRVDTYQVKVDGDDVLVKV